MKNSSSQIQIKQEPSATTTSMTTLFVEQMTFDENNSQQSNEER